MTDGHDAEKLEELIAILGFDPRELGVAPSALLKTAGLTGNAKVEKIEPEGDNKTTYVVTYGRELLELNDSDRREVLNTIQIVAAARLEYARQKALAEVEAIEPEYEFFDHDDVIPHDIEDKIYAGKWPGNQAKIGQETHLTEEPANLVIRVDYKACSVTITTSDSHIVNHLDTRKQILETGEIAA